MEVCIIPWIWQSFKVFSMAHGNDQWIEILGATIGTSDGCHTFQDRKCRSASFLRNSRSPLSQPVFPSACVASMPVLVTLPWSIYCCTPCYISPLLWHHNMTHKNEFIFTKNLHLSAARITILLNSIYVHISWAWKHILRYLRNLASILISLSSPLPPLTPTFSAPSWLF